MHTLWAREHNTVAQKLAEINPHWDDEILFQVGKIIFINSEVEGIVDIFNFVSQEARHIIIAMIQHITFNEFLPVVLGKDMITKFNLLLQKEVFFQLLKFSQNFAY